MNGMIKVYDLEGKQFEGTVFAVDPVTSTLVLKNKESSYTMFTSSQISKIEGDLSQYTSPDIAECGVNTHAIEKNEIKALAAADKSIDAINFKVSEEIQTLFDRLNFIFPCEWQGVSMVVLGEFIIHPPYDKVQLIHPSGEGAGLDRVVKVLEGERQKLRL